MTTPRHSLSSHTTHGPSGFDRRAVLLGATATAAAMTALTAGVARAAPPGGPTVDNTTELQLRIAGWATPTEQPAKTYLAVDGVLGPRTKAALQRFQHDHGLPQTGASDEATQRALARLASTDGSTAHFNWAEFYSHDGSRLSGGQVGEDQVRRNLRRLMYKLEALRRKAGDRPIRITSGFRSRAHNAALAARSRAVAGNSMHMYGIAADIQVEGLRPPQVATLAKTCGLSGIFVYEAWVHVDSRVEFPSYGARTWEWP